MSFKSMPFQSFKNFVQIVESRLPLKIKIVAELRLIWKEIVGDYMATRSQIAKCEYLPQKDEEGRDTGFFHRRLLIFVNDQNIKSVMTEYISQYLERIPKRFKIHSMRIQYHHKDFMLKNLNQKKISQNLQIMLSQEDQEIIQKKVSALGLDLQMSKNLIDFLSICWNQKNKGK